ncbi:Hint domain-containing protein [Shimia sp. SDUM112013]|uniref:Hint domain-containing protein n=1 Tax=Shimia sp. SDUM112013 TaxID=3136160 RepID=UPI0032EE89CE
MADYSFWALGESYISVSGGEQLDGVTQGDGSHLVGETITLNDNAWEQIFVSDGGSDINFDDNDGNQRLDGTQSFDGVTYSNNTRIEAEYEFTLRDPNTGLTYRVLSVNFATTSPSYGTIEGLAFVDEFPPIGVALDVISAREGPSGGSAVPEGEIAAPPCFTPGTQIRTPEKDRAVETLQVGDLVETLDHGPQPIRWIGTCTVSPMRMRLQASFRPVRIRKNAFGPGRPCRDMLVSQQHRIFLQDWRTELLFGEAEMLVAAVHLVNDRTVTLAPAVAGTTYIHLQFDRHEILFSDGLPSESLNPGLHGLRSLPEASRTELASLFPELDLTRSTPLAPARTIARRWEAGLLRN